MKCVKVLQINQSHTNSPNDDLYKIHKTVPIHDVGILWETILGQIKTNTCVSANPTYPHF